jgi:hypothetical protein
MPQQPTILHLPNEVLSNIAKMLIIGCAEDANTAVHERLITLTEGGPYAGFFGANRFVYVSSDSDKAIRSLEALEWRMNRLHESCPHSSDAWDWSVEVYAQWLNRLRGELYMHVTTRILADNGGLLLPCFQLARSRGGLKHKIKEELSSLKEAWEAHPEISPFYELKMVVENLRVHNLWVTSQGSDI